MKPWLRYLISRPSFRRKLRRVNFSEYGVVAVFHKQLFNAVASVESVAIVPGGLAIGMDVQEFVNYGWGPPAVRVPFVLIRVKKDSLPAPVKKLYIFETVT